MVSFFYKCKELVITMWEVSLSIFGRSGESGDGMLNSGGIAVSH